MRLNPCLYSRALRAIFDPNLDKTLKPFFIKNKIKIFLVHVYWPGRVCGEFGRNRSR